jgi:hypothetical protein
MIGGELFCAHKQYVRRQMIYCLLQVRFGGVQACTPAYSYKEEDNATLHMVTAMLLFDGRANENDSVFEDMHEEGTFPRIVSLIQSPEVQEDERLHRMLLELMYESSRVQRLKWEDFSMSNLIQQWHKTGREYSQSSTVAIDDAFILYLLEIIEGASDDADDPYHYTVIRVLVCCS